MQIKWELPTLDSSLEIKWFMVGYFCYYYLDTLYPVISHQDHFIAGFIAEPFGNQMVLLSTPWAQGPGPGPGPQPPPGFYFHRKPCYVKEMEIKMGRDNMVSRRGDLATLIVLRRLLHKLRRIGRSWHRRIFSVNAVSAYAVLPLLKIR